jgi:hypothetical protein
LIQVSAFEDVFCKKVDREIWSAPIGRLLRIECTRRACAHLAAVALYVCMQRYQCNTVSPESSICLQNVCDLCSKNCLKRIKKLCSKRTSAAAELQL